VVLTAQDISLEEGHRLRRQAQLIAQKGAFSNEDLLVELRYVATVAARRRGEAR
jgi:hypothetical protein